MQGKMRISRSTGTTQCITRLRAKCCRRVHSAVQSSGGHGLHERKGAVFPSYIVHTGAVVQQKRHALPVQFHPGLASDIKITSSLWWLSLSLSSLLSLSLLHYHHQRNQGRFPHRWRCATKTPKISHRFCWKRNNNDETAPKKPISHIQMTTHFAHHRSMILSLQNDEHVTIINYMIWLIND